MKVEHNKLGQCGSASNADIDAHKAHVCKVRHSSLIL